MRGPAAREILVIVQLARLARAYTAVQYVRRDCAVGFLLKLCHGFPYANVLTLEMALPDEQFFFLDESLSLNRVRSYRDRDS